MTQVPFPLHPSNLRTQYKRRNYSLDFCATDRVGRRDRGIDIKRQVLDLLKDIVPNPKPITGTPCCRKWPGQCKVTGSGHDVEIANIV